jgi:hypothetical protein
MAEALELQTQTGFTNGVIPGAPETTFGDDRDPYENIIITGEHRLRLLGGAAVTMFTYTYNPQELPRN